MSVYRLFGNVVASEFPLLGLAPEPVTEADVQLRLVGRTELETPTDADGWGRTIALGWGEAIESVQDERGIWLRYEDKARFHISLDGGVVRCAPADPDAADWQHILLDTVLGTAALCRGQEGLHAAAVSLPEGVVAISADSGGGKTTLCVELIRRGGRLFADDLVFFKRGGGRVLAQPGPPLMTIPAADAAGVGEPLATIGDQVWTTVSQAVREPAELSACIVLDRRADVDGARLELERSPLALLQAGLVSGASPERRRGRFELLADLLGEMRLLRLVAGEHVPVHELATLVESATAMAPL